MTKHLRLIMLSLLAMIFLGGYAQSETVFKTLSFPDENQSKNGLQNYTDTWYAKIGSDTWVIDKFNNNRWDNNWKYIKCGSKKDATIASIATENAFDAPISKVVVSYGKVSATDKLNEYYLQIASDAAFTKDVVTIDGKLENSGAFDYTFTIPTPVKGRYFKLVYDIQQTDGNGTIQVDKVEYWQKAESGTTATTLSFKDLVGEGVTLINGKLANGDDFNGYTATEKDNVPGTIAYAASGDGVATVDRTTGEVTVDPNVSGTTKITATFTPNEEKTYAGSTASYTITNTKVYTSIADLKKDITTVKEKSFVLNLTKAIVTYTNRNNVFIQDESAGILIYMNNHGLKAGNTFTGTVNVKAMLYKDLAEITSWTSTVTPTQSEVPEPVVVTLAELTGDNYSKYESVRCKVVGVTVTKGMKVQDGEISQNGTVMAVRGGVKSLTMNEGAILDMIGYPSIFNGTKQFQVWKDSDMTEHQTVKEITLDENSDNIVEKAKNVNVTLKRTLVGDGDWNTLCVPFSLTEAQTKAAFGADVELRELESVAGNTLTFKKVNSVTANVPCLIKLSEAYAKDTYTFTGVNTVAAKVDDFGSDKVNAAISFIGIYSSKDVTEWATEGKDYVAYLGANNTFFKAKAGTKMKAFRAFFVIPENTPASAVKAVIDGNATGIEDLVIDGVKANGRVYNLNGQYVGNSLNGLQPGLYIQNGKKIVVK